MHDGEGDGDACVVLGHSHRRQGQGESSSRSEGHSQRQGNGPKDANKDDAEANRDAAKRDDGKRDAKRRADDVALGVAAFFYQKALALQPLDVRAAAGFLATTRTADEATSSEPLPLPPLSPGQRPGRRERRAVLTATVRNLEAVEEGRGGIASQTADRLAGRLSPGAAKGIAIANAESTAPMLATAWLLVAKAADAPEESTTRRALVERGQRLVQFEGPILRHLLQHLASALGP